jgi:hypothetical protein
MVAAYYTQATGDWDTVFEFCRRALEADSSQGVPSHGHRIEMDTCSLKAQAALAGGNYIEAVSAYARAAELASADGYTGMAGIFLGYGVNCALLGSVEDIETIEQAEKAVALARQSGMPGAIVLTLNALALALVDHEPSRSRAVLRESIELGSTPGEEISSGVLTASLVAGRLRDWDLTLTLTAQTMHLWRWSTALMQGAPCLALCARALAETRPEVAGVLRGAAYAAYGRARPSHGALPDNAPRDSNANFILAALREAGDLVSAAIGEQRRQELRAQGAAMSMDEAVAYALANIDPKLLTGPIASIDR